jgi:hypothetical protein
MHILDDELEEGRAGSVNVNCRKDEDGRSAVGPGCRGRRRDVGGCGWRNSYAHLCSPVLARLAGASPSPRAEQALGTYPILYSRQHRCRPHVVRAPMRDRTLRHPGARAFGVMPARFTDRTTIC